jgi:hypothetical protein
LAPHAEVRGFHLGGFGCQDVDNPQCLNALEDAWAAVHEVLPAGWTVMPPSHRIEEGTRPWHVVAVDLRSRALRKEYVEATGWTEAEALRDLAALLGGWHVEDVEAVYF